MSFPLLHPPGLILQQPSTLNFTSEDTSANLSYLRLPPGVLTMPVGHVSHNYDSNAKDNDDWCGRSAEEGGEPAEPRRRRRRGRGAHMRRNLRRAADYSSMGDILATLRDMPCNQILLVRRIDELGDDAADIIRTYLEDFAAVIDVFVPQSLVLSPGRTFTCPARPANLAFVVMENAAAVDALLLAGREHKVSGCAVYIERASHLPVDDSSNAVTDLMVPSAEDHGVSAASADTHALLGIEEEGWSAEVECRWAVLKL